jgi:quercetin dioxygenase-like cupin family protein
MQPAALAGLDLANLDMRTALNLTAAYSSSDYLRRPRIPWRRNVLLMDGGAAESRARVDRKHGLWGVLRSGKDITASQSCHLAAFDITTKVGAWGIPSHPLHYHDFDVQEVCWQHNSSLQYEFAPLAAPPGRGGNRGPRAGTGSLAVWEGSAGTVTYLPGGEGHRYRCAGDGVRLAGGTVEFVRQPCMTTCLKLIPRTAPAPKCKSLLAGLEPIRVGGAELQVGIVVDALGWLDRNVNQRRARRGAKPGQLLHTPLLRGINPDRSRTHVHVDYYPEGATLPAHAASFDVFIAVMRGACWVEYSEGQGGARRAVERQAKTGNIVFQPAGANLTITTRLGQTARLLVVEIAAAEK